MSAPLAIALTCGDAAGVGAEIAARAWLAGGLDPFFLIDDVARVGALPGVPHVPVIAIDRPEAAVAAFHDGLPVLHHPLDVDVSPGIPAPHAAGWTIAGIERAVTLTRTGVARAVVTNPINKAVLYEGAGFAFPGHTEFLAHLGDVTRTVMMLAAPGIRVVPLTIHVPLAEVPGLISASLIDETVRIVDAALRRDFGIASPRIAVAGLNPHAGEDGAMGREEQTVIRPALDALAAEGFAVMGPMPADTMFHPAARARYDVALTMYHDQGLIPIKTIDFARGVNVTLGLPFVRTSPDHGTAYDIAGKGVADASSLIEAIRLAGAMADARAVAAA